MDRGIKLEKYLHQNLIVRHALVILSKKLLENLFLQNI